MNRLLTLLVLLTCGICSGQKNPTSKNIFSPEELKQDFTAFRTSLEECHPGLYLYKSKAVMDSIFQATFSSIKEPMTDRAFMILLCTVASQVGDGHLKVVPPKIRLDSLDEGATAIPFNVYYKKNKMDFEKFLKTSFEKIQSSNTSNLIIDVRDNGAGTDEYGRILFSYLINQDFDYYKSLRMNKESFETFKYTSKPDMKAPKGMLKSNGEGTFDNVQHPNAGKQKPSLPTYQGNIYVLINGGCFSTTSEFLSLLHFHTKAIFIGEESGGGYYGNCSGPTPDFTLPNTKVRMEIPLMNYRMAVKDYQYSDRGIIPNYTVLPTVMDKIKDNDLELNFANKLIEKK